MCTARGCCVLLLIQVRYMSCMRLLSPRLQPVVPEFVHRHSVIMLCVHRNQTSAAHGVPHLVMTTDQ
jgi:hypothetical protein